MLVTTVRRPLEGEPFVTATLRNEGKAAAEISYVEFFPAEVVEIPRSVASQLVDTAAADKLVVVYDASENRTQTIGKHGKYGRDLTESFVVPAGESVDLQIAIADRRHLGWGFRGTLRIDDLAGGDIEIENATLAFVEVAP